jgi:hypothetical protein
MSLPVSKKSLTETDIRTKFITPAVLGPDGSKWDSMTQVRAAIACIAQAFNWRFSTVVMVRNFSTQPRLHSRCSNRRTPNMHTPRPLADVDRPVTRADESAASAAHWLANPITEAEKLPTLAQRWAAEPEWDGPDPTGDDSPA